MPVACKGIASFTEQVGREPSDLGERTCEEYTEQLKDALDKITVPQPRTSGAAWTRLVVHFNVDRRTVIKAST